MELREGRPADCAARSQKEKRVYDFLEALHVPCACVGGHPCVNTASLRLRTADAFGPFLDAVHHSDTPAQLAGEAGGQG